MRNRSVLAITPRSAETGHPGRAVRLFSSPWFLLAREGGGLCNGGASLRFLASHRVVEKGKKSGWVVIETKKEEAGQVEKRSGTDTAQLIEKEKL